MKSLFIKIFFLCKSLWLTENSDHNRIASMSCLKKVIDTMEIECGKSFTNVDLLSDRVGAQFRFRFIFQLSAGTMFLNKSLCWFYNEWHHGKGPMDGVGGIIKSVIFRKVNSGQIVVHTLKKFSDAAMKFLPSIITVYLPRSDEIVESQSIHQAPSIPEILLFHKFIRQINDAEEIAILNFSRRRSTRKPFTLNGTTKLVMLFLVTRSPIKAITSVQYAGNGVQKTGVNGYNVAFASNGFTRQVFTFKSNF